MNLGRIERDGYQKGANSTALEHIRMMMKCCLMSLDVSWHIRDKLWQCRSTVQSFFTSTETRRLVRTDSPGRPPRLSHSSWTMSTVGETAWAYGFCSVMEDTSVCASAEERSCQKGVYIVRRSEKQAGGGGDSSVVRAPDSWLKGRGFESLLERRENFLLQGRLSVLTLISVSVPPPCYHSST